MFMEFFCYYSNMLYLSVKNWFYVILNILRVIEKFSFVFWGIGNDLFFLEELVFRVGWGVKINDIL